MGDMADPLYRQPSECVTVLIDNACALTNIAQIYLPVAR